MGLLTPHDASGNMSLSISPLPQRHRHVHGKSDGIDFTERLGHTILSMVDYRAVRIVLQCPSARCTTPARPNPNRAPVGTVHCTLRQYNRLSQTRFRSSLFRNHSINALLPGDASLRTRIAAILADDCLSVSQLDYLPLFFFACHCQEYYSLKEQSDHAAPMACRAV